MIPNLIWVARSAVSYSMYGLYGLKRSEAKKRKWSQKREAKLRVKYQVSNFWFLDAKLHFAYLRKYCADANKRKNSRKRQAKLRVNKSKFSFFDVKLRFALLSSIHFEFRIVILLPWLSLIGKPLFSKSISSILWPGETESESDLNKK